ncbi:hypothetical protein EDC04DRAFT_2611655 [Pisolithus marmoratus]|nr:hypothetical protein EDC04DRAFT_2611655 [Pisolithus marmoratus]
MKMFVRVAFLQETPIFSSKGLMTKGFVPTHPAIKDEDVHKGSILTGNTGLMTKGFVPTCPAIEDKDVCKGSVLTGNTSFFCTLKGIHLIETSPNVEDSRAVNGGKLLPCWV